MFTLYQCTGLPSPCTACAGNDVYCQFSPKLDARRRGSYELLTTRFLLIAILRTLRHTKHADMFMLLELIQNPQQPVGSFSELQRRVILPSFDFDDSDLRTLLLPLLLNPRCGRSAKLLGDSSDEDNDSADTLSGCRLASSERVQTLSIQCTV